MKKLTVLSFVVAMALSLTGCQQASGPSRDGVCNQIQPGGLPMPIDPDCGSASPAK